MNIIQSVVPACTFIIKEAGSKIVGYATPQALLAVAAVGMGIALGERVIGKRVISDKILRIYKAVLTRLPCSSSVAKESSRMVGSNLINGMGRVVFLPQTHWVPEMENHPIAIEECWYAQLKIAEYLQAHPDDAVSIEGLSETLKEPPYVKSLLAFDQFPKGIIPSEDASWTLDQKRFLAENGGAKTLWYLGKIKTLDRSIDPQTEKETQRVIHAEFAKGNRNYYDEPLYSAVFTRREAALAEEVRSFLKNPKNKGRKINIVFGHGHDFSKYFKPGSIMRRSGFIALEVLNNFVACDPQNTAYRLERANYLFSLGRWEEALSDYQFVHSKEPENVQAKEKITQIKRIMASERSTMLQTGNTVKHVKSQSHEEFDHLDSQIKPGTTLIFDGYFKSPNCYQKMNVPRPPKLVHQRRGFSFWRYLSSRLSR